MKNLERLEAEFTLAKLEDEFAQRKARDGGVTKEDREMLRAARESFRLNYRLPREEGASPAPIGASAKPLWSRIMDVMRMEA
jgi:hypothetical protein